MSHRLRLGAGVSLLVLVLGGCTEGAYNDPEILVEPGTGGDTGGEGPAMDCADFFARNVQPELDYCRSCHVPDGVGDVPDGERLQFSDDRDEDLARLHEGWQQLGGNNPTSRILTMASGTDAQSHSGGEPWPVNGAVYNDVETLLQGFDSGWCDAALGGR